MSRFNQYINENNQVMEIIENIRKKCKPYLKEYNRYFRNNQFFYQLYSGRNTSTNYMKVKVRKNRTPKDMLPETHNFLDLLFKERFRIKARSESVFCTGNRRVAEKYGKTFVIFPVGKYEILWSDKVNDLYSYIDTESLFLDNIEYVAIHGCYNGYTDVEFKNCVETRTKELEKIRKDGLEDIVSEYNKGNLFKAIHSGNEIMLVCNKYIAVLESFFIKNIKLFIDYLYNDG